MNNKLDKKIEEQFDAVEMLGYLTFKRAEGLDYDNNFEDELLAKLKKTDKKTFQTNRSFYPWLRFGMLTASLLIILFAATTYINHSNKPGIVTVADAKEMVRKKMEVMFKDNTIYHQKTAYKVFDENGNPADSITYELWEDQNSPMIRNITTYTDNTSVIINDGKILWNYDSKTNTLNKEIFSGSSTGKTGYAVDLVQKFKSLVESDKVTADTIEENGKRVIVISEKYDADDGEDNHTFIVKYFFDKEDFRLIKILTYKVTNDASRTEVIQSSSEYLALDSQARSEKTLKSLFTFNYPLPDNVKIFERNTDGSTTSNVNITVEISPSLLDLSSEGNHEIIIRTKNADINSKDIVLGQYEDRTDGNYFTNKVNLDNISSYVDSINNTNNFTALVPATATPGIYYVLIIGTSSNYGPIGPIEIVNNIAILKPLSAIPNLPFSLSTNSIDLSNQKFFEIYTRIPVKADGSDLDNFSPKVLIGQYEFKDNAKIFSEKYYLSYTKGSMLNDSKYYLVISVILKENISSGEYYVKLDLNDGQSYISKDTIQIVNSTMKTYINNIIKYSIQYPADWNVLESSDNNIRFFKGINSPNQPIPQNYISLQVKSNPSKKPLREWLIDNNIIPTDNIIASQNVTRDFMNNNGVRGVFVLTNNNTGQGTTYIAKNEYVLQIMTVYTDPSALGLDSLLSVEGRMLASLKLLN